MTEKKVFSLASASLYFSIYTWTMIAIQSLIVTVSIAVCGASGMWWAPMLLVLGLYLFSLGLWAALRPSRFEAQPEGVHIVYPLRSRRIPWTDIQHAEVLGEHDVGVLRKRLSGGMMFGLFGACRSSNLGPLDACVSRKDGSVLIELYDGRQLLVSPDRPEEFADTVNSVIHGN